jgi:hypothetical protein
MNWAHRSAIALLATVAAMAATAGPLIKCTAPDGKVTYTERLCDNTQQQGKVTRSNSWSGTAPPLPAADPSGLAGAKPYIKTTQRCRYLDKTVQEWSEKAKNLKAPAIDSNVTQQRAHYQAAFDKECIDPQAKEAYEKKQVVQPR